MKILRKYSPLAMLIPLAYTFFFAWFSLLGPTRPIANWDMFPYVGAAYGLTISAGELRSAALADIRRYVSDEQYRAITSGSDYREIVAQEDHAFLQQLPMYRVKPLYVLLIALLGAITGNLAMATVILSATGFFLIGIALYLLRPPGRAGGLWLLAVMGIAYLGTPQIVLLAQASTPDSMATGLLLLGLAAFFRKIRIVAAAVLFSLAVTARPDYIVPIMLLVPVLVRARLDNLCNTSSVCALTFTPTCVFMLLKLLAPPYGLATILSHAVFEPLPYPADQDVLAVAESYLPRLQADLTWLLTLPRFMLFTAAGILLFIFSRDAYVKLIVLAATVSVIAKILLFPHPDGGYQERYFFLSYFLTLIGLFRFLGSPLFEPRHVAENHEDRGK